MTVNYTDQSYESLHEATIFLIENLGIPIDKALEIRKVLLNKAESLSSNPFKGQKEEYLDHLKKDYRRIFKGHFKIIYRIEGDEIFITDFFDTRQDPEKMQLFRLKCN